MVKYKLKILHRTYKVIEQPQVKGPNDIECHGLTDSQKGFIMLATGDLEDQPALRKEVLIHEIIHAISDMLELGLKEKQVNGLGLALAGVLNDNPKFVKQELL